MESYFEAARRSLQSHLGPRSMASAGSNNVIGVLTNATRRQHAEKGKVVVEHMVNGPGDGAGLSSNSMSTNGICNTDPLTRLANRRCCSTQVSGQTSTMNKRDAMYSPDRERTSIIFKKFNDTLTAHPGRRQGCLWCCRSGDEKYAAQGCGHLAPWR